MNTHYLASLFTPESIALYGASDRVDSVGGVVFKNLIKSGYKGRIYAINPKRSEVQGQKAFASLEDIDEPVDLVVVATPASSIRSTTRTTARGSTTCAAAIRGSRGAPR